MHRMLDKDGNLLTEDRGTVPLHAGAFAANGSPLDGPAGRASAKELQARIDAEVLAFVQAADMNDAVDKTGDRQAAIMAAIVAITRRADPAEFTADRKPRIEVVRQITGLDDITATERDSAIANLQQDED